MTAVGPIAGWPSSEMLIIRCRIQPEQMIRPA
jgi:hypothetical protein